jgi:hypothetical protein
MLIIAKTTAMNGIEEQIAKMLAYYGVKAGQLDNEDEDGP